MSKIGVGVGDDFPVDDSNNRVPPPRDDRAEFEEWKRRRDAHRAQREAWRTQKEEWRNRRDEWKAQWREQRRAWRDEQGDGRAYYDGASPHGRRRHRHYPFGFGYGFLTRILFAVAVIALVVFAFTHIGYILAGLVAIGVLFAAWHHFGHDPFDLSPRERDYSRPMTPPPPAQPPATTPQDPAA